MTRSMVSRANLEKVAALAGIAAGGSDADGEQVIADLRAGTQIKAERNGLFIISYKDKDPQRAYRMARALLDIFMQAYLGSTRSDLASAQEFLAEQIRQYEDRVREVESRLATFKQQNQGLLPGGATFLEHMTRSQQEVDAIRSEMEDLQARRLELAKMLDAQPQFLEFDGAAGGGPPSGLDIRILEIEQRRDDLRLRYTDQHPDVIQATQLLSQLRAEQAATGLDGEDASGRGGRTMVPNELYRSIQMKLIDIDTQMAALRNTLARKHGTAQELRSRVTRAPEIEAELVRLTREHEMARRNYEELLARQEAARLSHNREMQEEKVQFRVIDPPQVPTTPSGLQRSVLVTGVLLAGILAGMGIGLLTSLMRRIFVTPAQLADVTGLPVLGGISSIAQGRSPSAQAFRLASLAGCWIALLSLYAGLLALDHQAGLSTLRSRLITFAEPADQTLPSHHHG